MLTKVFELPFYNPRFTGSIFKNNVFKRKFNEKRDRLLTAFLDYAQVDHCHWTGKIIGLAHNTWNLQAAIVYPKINVYAHNSAFVNQVMNLSACFGKCFNFWNLEELEEVMEEKVDPLNKQYKETISHCSLENHLFCISKTVSKALIYNF